MAENGGLSAQPDGRDSEGQTWLHWIVHEKWPVYCANLMSSLLLVIEPPSSMSDTHKFFPESMLA